MHHVRRGARAVGVRERAQGHVPLAADAPRGAHVAGLLDAGADQRFGEGGADAVELDRHGGVVDAEVEVVEGEGEAVGGRLGFWRIS